MKDPFYELPPRVRKKIQRDETNPGACWIWTGSIRPAGAREHLLRTPKNPTPGRPRGRPRTSDVAVCHERALPKLHSSTLGYAVPAHREIYAICKGIPYRDLAKLTRCHNDRCVNPDHQHQTPHTSTRTGRRTHQGPAKAPDAQTDALAVLKASKPRPAAFLSRELAAEEIGVPEITEAQWAEFVAWDAENPEAEE